MRAGLFALASAVLMPAAAAAQDAIDPEAFCRNAGRNQAIFEMEMATATAQAGAEAGSVTCSWTFKPMGKPEISVTLDSRLMASPLVARQAILLARLPENHRGKTVEPLPKLGDDGLSRATVENGVTTMYEIEAVKGRRHFLLTVRPRQGGDVTYRTAGVAINFLGAGISGL